MFISLINFPICDKNISELSKLKNPDRNVNRKKIKIYNQ
jgi:hypothetical protein